MDYLVTWRIDIEADTPEQAASMALLVQLDPKSEATIFTVLDKERGNEFEVDLGEVAS